MNPLERIAKLGLVAAVLGAELAHEKPVAPVVVPLPELGCPARVPEEEAEQQVQEQGGDEGGCHSGAS